jgi:hypothetical protein
MGVVIEIFVKYSGGPTRIRVTDRALYNIQYIDIYNNIIWYHIIL